MGGIRNIFGGSKLEKLMHQAQRKLAAEDFDQAHKILQKGRKHYPDADVLRDMELTVRRAQARAGIQELRARIERGEEPRAYEELISLYLELGLFAEARHEALAYANAHPDRDAAHLLLGEMSLQAFFEDLRASDGHVAQRRLTRAASLNPQALKPRLLLAELYFCAGADRALSNVVRELEEVAREDPVLEPLLEKIASIDAEAGPQGLDGLFESLEVQGALNREPTAWPLRSRRTRVSRLDEDRAKRAANALVKDGSPIEVAMIQRGGSIVAHARTPNGESSDEATEDGGLVDITRTVSRTVSRHAREFDLGSFKSVTIQGSFGLVTVGEVGGVVTAARWRSSAEPQRLWERVTVQLESTLGARR